VTSEELLQRVQSSWEDLNALVSRLDDAALSRPGPEEWAVKDHLVHVAAWEHSLIALLEGRDREAAMGLAAGTEENTEAINHAIWQIHRETPAPEDLRYFRETHAQLRSVLAKLSTADIEKPYSHYQPGDPDENRPVIGWIESNTYEHYDEHAGYIKQLIASPGPS
jgi:hypothetical protein